MIIHRLLILGIKEGMNNRESITVIHGNVSASVNTYYEALAYNWGPTPAARCCSSVPSSKALAAESHS